MKARILAFGFILTVAGSARAGSLAYVQCGTYDSYLLLYKSTERFEELAKLRCGEKVEVLSHSGSYAQIRTLDGRLGWVSDADISDAPPPPQRVFTFGLTEQSHSSAPSPAPVHRASFLTNEDILAMRANHPSSDLILKKIKSSRCDFDMSPAQLHTLRASGLPDTVILAMLAAPIASETSGPTAPESLEVRIPDGTSLEVQLNGSVSSEELQDGTIVEMSAAEDLVVNGSPIILRGAPARGRILAVKQPGTHGGSGEVAWFMQDVVAVSGVRIPVTFTPKQPGNTHTGLFAGYPYLISKFRKGDPAISAADKRFRIAMHGENVLTLPQSLAAGVPGQKPKTQSIRQVSTEQTVEPEAAPLPQPAEPGDVKP
jgi:SH3 domain-containing protein